MLILCSSCKSKYLVNSADLKPHGRTVQCAKCGHNWYQTASLEIDEDFSRSAPSTSNEAEEFSNDHKKNKLPSTIVKEEKVSYLNSLLVLFLSFSLIIIFWILKKNGINSFVLINYYIKEFYFNFKMIIDDLAKIIFEILN
tara:strand:+ start:5451 stop:5873 length:423 start_codon:yes stop_codon:yes gene_type:complete